MIIAIASFNAQRVIGGKDGKIPWHIPEEFAHFKKMTLKSPCIMGRKTYASIPDRYKPLPERTNIVITRNPHAIDKEKCVNYMPAFRYIEGPFYVKDLEVAIILAKKFLTERIFIIGGEEIFKWAFQDGVVDKIIASEVIGYDTEEGIAHFPLPKDWDRRILEEHKEFNVVEYIPGALSTSNWQK